jgi:hypothetical protein
MASLAIYGSWWSPYPSVAVSEKSAFEKRSYLRLTGVQRRLRRASGFASVGCVDKQWRIIDVKAA